MSDRSCISSFWIWSIWWRCLVQIWTRFSHGHMYVQLFMYRTQFRLLPKFSYVLWLVSVLLFAYYVFLLFRNLMECIGRWDVLIWMWNHVIISYCPHRASPRLLYREQYTDTAQTSNNCFFWKASLIHFSRTRLCTAVLLSRFEQ